MDPDSPSTGATGQEGFKSRRSRPVHRGMSRITACMIVRDEAKRLPACLEALAPWVDEVCVVDTGSTDATVAIAQKHGARVESFEWCEDFSAARNVSLAMATHPWILVVDADEVLEAETGPALRRAVNDPAAQAWLIRVDSLDSGGRKHTIAVPRLFRNRAEIRFSRPVHESVMESLRSIEQGAPSEVDVVLTHFGYLPEVVAEKDKYARNADILRQRVMDADDDLFSTYKLARTLKDPADFQEQLAAYEVAYKLSRNLSREERLSHPFMPLLYEGYCGALISFGELGYALRVITQGLKDMPDCVELIWRRGDLARRLGDWEGARRYLMACFRPRRIQTLFATDGFARTVKPAMGLAVTMLELRKIEDAARYAERAIRFEPNYWPAHCLSVKLALAMGDGEGATRKLDELLAKAPTAPSVCGLGGELAWMQGDVPAAVELWSNAKGTCDDAHEARAWQAIGELCLGFYDRAAAHLPHLDDRDLMSAAARLLVAVATGAPYGRGNAIPNRRLLHRLVRWLRELINVGAEAALENFAENAAEYRAQVPGVEMLLERPGSQRTAQA